jgi:hypothetical protein
MNKVIILCIVCCLLILPSCDSISSTNKQPLEFTLVFHQDTFQSFKDVSATLTLKNVGKKDLLVSERMACIPRKFPPGITDCVLVVTDKSGEQIRSTGHIDMAVTSEDFFVVLAPGEILERRVSFQSLGLRDPYFKENELYTVVAIYQNSLDATQTVDGKEVKAWIGEVQSNSDTFMVVP